MRKNPNRTHKILRDRPKAQIYVLKAMIQGKRRFCHLLCSKQQLSSHRMCDLVWKVTMFQCDLRQDIIILSRIIDLSEELLGAEEIKAYPQLISNLL